MHSPSETALVMSILFALAVYVLARCLWLMKKRSAFFIQADEMVRSRLVEDGTFGANMDCEKTINEYFDSIWGIPRMLLPFWIWDIGRMVKDQKKFDEVMNFVKEEG